MITSEQYKNNYETNRVDESNTLSALPKHAYPRWIQFWAFSTLLASAWLIFYFWIYELPYHRTICNALIYAENSFQEGYYQEAYAVYARVVEKQPHYKKGFLRLGQILLSQSTENDDTYQLAIECLSHSACTEKDLPEIYPFVPPMRKAQFTALVSTLKEKEVKRS